MKKAADLEDDDSPPPAIDDGWTVETEGAPNMFPKLARFGIAFGGFLALLLVAIAVVPVFIPQTWSKPYAEGLLKNTLGADLRINGSHSFRILPSLRLTAENVVQADGTDMPNRILSFKRLDIEMGAFAALSGSFDLSRVEIDEPSLVYRYGMGAMHTAGKSARKIDQSWGWWRDMTVADLDIKNGSATFTDVSSGHSISITKFRIQRVASVSKAVEALSFEGRGTVNGHEATVRVDTADPQLLVSGNRWPIDLKVQAPLLSVSFDGSLALRERWMAEGAVAFASTDAGSLNGWIGPWFPVRAGGSFSLTGELDTTIDAIKLDDINLSLGDTQVGGYIQIVGAAEGRPRIDGELQAETLDFGTGGMPSSAGGVIDLIETFPAGRLDVLWHQLLWRHYRFGIGSAVVEGEPNTQHVNLTVLETAAYGGSFRGNVTLDRSEGMRALSIEAKALDVAVGPFLSSEETQGSPPLSGKMTLDLKLFSVGGSPVELRRALTGEADVVIRDGALVLPELTAELAPDAVDTIDFSTMSGFFQIGQGIAHSDDLIMRADGLSLVGKGSVDLDDGMIDLEVGRIDSRGGARSVQRYRIDGPAADIRVEATN